ncbi:MAG TPA: MarR family transcriptional regulator [Armatimonadota bacterium]|jgi:DNA-binding MarR family transcriptional regulator
MPKYEFCREDLLNAVFDTAWEQVLMTVQHAAAAAHDLGINLTDFKCVDLVRRNGAVTAGQLAEYAGLTTGAITGAIDRLEKAGMVYRDRDGSDRRKVLVRLRPEVRADIEEHRAAEREAMTAAYAGYGEEELALIRDYLERTSRVMRGQFAEMVKRPPLPPAADPSESA